jgi:hypothetical protein
MTKLFKVNHKKKLRYNEAYCPYCQTIFNIGDGHDCWERRMSDGSEFLKKEEEVIL